MTLTLSKPNNPSKAAKEVMTSPVAGSSTLVLGLSVVVTEVVAACNLFGNGVGLTVAVGLELVVADDPGFLPGLIVSPAESLLPSVVAAITNNLTVSV